MDLTLRGKIANIPASEVEVVIDRHPLPHPYPGQVDERMFMALPGTDDRDFTTPHSDTRIDDTITNAGTMRRVSDPYHANYDPLVGSRGLARWKRHPLQRPCRSIGR